jgi:CRP-like cAMP-binding protein
MNTGSQKLRSLARQARLLSATCVDRRRTQALEALARLYEQQAQDLETPELA